MSSKAKKSRPVSTGVISQPQVHDSSTLTALAHFSPNADLFSLLSLAVDKHRLRVFDATTGSALVEHIVDDARVTTIAWTLLDLSVRPQQPRTKKRKKMIEPGAETPEGLVQIVVLGLSNGSLLLFSPTHARVLRTLSHPSSIAAVLAASIGTQPYQLWSSSADGTVRLWNVSRNELLGSWKNDGGIPYSALAPRLGQNSDETELLVANHAMRVLSLPASTPSISEPAKPDQLFSFTGHASSVSLLQWDASHPSRFISTAEADRFVNIWCVPDTPAKEGDMLASVPLDATARHAALSTDTTNLLTVSASGKVALFELPAPTKKSKVLTLSPRSTISAPSKKGDDDVLVVAAAFVPLERGSVRVARLKGGVRPVFEVVRYLDDAGEFIPQISLSKDVSTTLAASVDAGPSTSQKRYTEAPDLAVRSGMELGQDAEMDDIPTKGTDGDLDVDLAELSLGQRLTALSGGADVAMGDGSSAEEAASPTKTPRRRQKSRAGKDVDADHLPVPAHSLSRTLVQALHSGDTRLLETCLVHSDERLVLNTVRRLPPQLAVPLLNACVERLGRGARAGTGKGGGGGASAQRGTGLIRWVRAVLVVHTAHLMTIPGVVARLSGLHATLTTRLALRDPLLSLSGRLELVLSQIEMRSSIGPAPIAPVGRKSEQKGGKRAPVKYVEGESESDDEADEDEMEVEKDQDAGSVEDIELGGESGSDEADDGESLGDDDDDDEESEDEGSDEGPRLNGFIDDEAEEEEWSEDGDSDFDE